MKKIKTYQLKTLIKAGLIKPVVTYEIVEMSFEERVSKMSRLSKSAKNMFLKLLLVSPD